jgi:hypothetical protein
MIRPAEAIRSWLDDHAIPLPQDPVACVRDGSIE